MTDILRGIFQKSENIPGMEGQDKQNRQGKRKKKEEKHPRRQSKNQHK